MMGSRKQRDKQRKCGGRKDDFIIFGSPRMERLASDCMHDGRAGWMLLASGSLTLIVAAVDGLMSSIVYVSSASLLSLEKVDRGGMP